MYTKSDVVPWYQGIFFSLPWEVPQDAGKVHCVCAYLPALGCFQVPRLPIMAVTCLGG